MGYLRDQTDPFCGDWVVKKRSQSRLEELNQMLERDQREMEERVEHLSVITSRLERLNKQQDETTAEIQEIKNTLLSVLVMSGARDDIREKKSSPVGAFSSPYDSIQKLQASKMVVGSPSQTIEKQGTSAKGSVSTNSHTLNAPEALSIDGITSTSTRKMDRGPEEIFKKLSNATLELYEVIPHNEVNERSITGFLSSVHKCIDVYSV